MILATHDLDSLPNRQAPLPHHRAGLQYTRSGYGRKIPTTRQVQLPGSPRWRRVYYCIYSNIGTCYVPAGKDWIVIS